ncbi:MAG: hypothetical protein WAU68_01700 [Vitreimonas sp.]
MRLVFCGVDNGGASEVAFGEHGPERSIVRRANVLDRSNDDSCLTSHHGQIDNVWRFQDTSDNRQA